jgi:hypothetical protein
MWLQLTGGLVFKEIRSFSRIVLKWVVIIFVAIMVLELILYLQWHTLSAEKNTGLTMIQHLSEVKNMTANCWAREKALDINCNERIKPLLKTEGSRSYFMKSGELIGIDFENKVVVILSLNKEENDLRWRCAGTPVTAIPSSCSAL